MEVRQRQRHCSQSWARTILALSMVTTAVAFQAWPQCCHVRETISRKTIRQFAMGVDPNDLVHAASTAHHLDATTLEGTLSTLISTTVDGMQKMNLSPAHGHSQPLFGPPDPYLTSGHSIAPKLKEISDATTTSLDAATITKTSTNLDQLPWRAKNAIEHGKRVVDFEKWASAWQSGGSVGNVPGFAPEGGILPKHNPMIPRHESLASIDASSKFAKSWAAVMHKLPMAAVVYAIVDFGFLRRDADLYKEDIEEEPLEVAAETIAVTGVRLLAQGFVGAITLWLFFGAK